MRRSRSRVALPVETCRVESGLGLPVTRAGQALSTRGFHRGRLNSDGHPVRTSDCFPPAEAVPHVGVGGAAGGITVGHFLDPLVITLPAPSAVPRLSRRGLR